MKRQGAVAPTPAPAYFAPQDVPSRRAIAVLYRGARLWMDAEALAIEQTLSSAAFGLYPNAQSAAHLLRPDLVLELRLARTRGGILAAFLGTSVLLTAEPRIRDEARPFYQAAFDVYRRSPTAALLANSAGPTSRAAAALLA